MSKYGKHLRRAAARARQLDPAVSFRAGYRQALEDIERTGLRPMTDKTKREAADRALERWSTDG